ncbi:hypothetical protein BY996DRAFT_6427949 [Phakopsora pachyrhizi]|nr:hypothetical protein BY996DRAFT_6427949 [Phakopsora pachyrhizi]
MTWILRGSFLLGFLLIGALLAPGACSGQIIWLNSLCQTKESLGSVQACISLPSIYSDQQGWSLTALYSYNDFKGGTYHLTRPPRGLRAWLSQFSPIATVDSSLTGTERLGTKLQKSIIEKAKFLLNASKINANSQFSNYLNIPSNNTLGHLPHKPGPSLTTINTTNTNKRGSSIVTGVLSPNANQSTLSPNSIGFGKKSPQLFGRLRRNYQQQHLGTSNTSALREAVVEVLLVTGLCLLLLRLGYPKVLKNQKHGVDILESPTHIYKILEQIFLRKQLEIE